MAQNLFLSTLSLRRATRINRNIANGQSHFYPRSPCGERQFRKLLYPGSTRISIHALLAESDVTRVARTPTTVVFLSTLSLRRATKRLRQKLAEAIISIHALLAESDCTTIITICTASKFLSTLSLRRATYNATNQTWLVNISIHALLAESDKCAETAKASNTDNFYPRSPCGERLEHLLII